MTTTTTDAPRTRDEAQLRQLIADQLDAICARDLDRIMAPYAANAVLFDLKPPHQTRGADAWRQTWAACLPYFPEGLRMEVRDLAVTVGGDVAVAHWVQRFTGVEGHPATTMWMRITACYRRTGGRWEIFHDHCSVPFDPMTGQVVPDLEAAAATGCASDSGVQ